MRRAAIVLFAVMMFAGYSLGQSNGVPQWKVIAERHMANGTTPVTNAIIFTPQKSRAYRLTAYIGASGPSDQGFWTMEIGWTDLGGKATELALSATPFNYLADSQERVVVLSPSVGVPMMLNLFAGGDQSAVYDVVITIEELTH